MALKEFIFLFFIFSGLAGFLAFHQDWHALQIVALFWFSLCALKALVGDALRFSRPTLPSLFLFAYIALMAVPSVKWFFEAPSAVNIRYLFSVQSVLAAFPFGVALAVCITRNASVHTKAFLYGVLQKTKADKAAFPFFLFFLISTIPILFLYAYYAHRIQLLDILRSASPSVGAEEFRFAQKEVPDFVHILFEFLRRFALPFSMLYAYFLSSFSGISWKRAFWVLFAVTLLTSSLTLDRAEPVALFIMLIFAHILIKKTSVFAFMRNAKLLGIAALAMVAGGLISIFQYQGTFSVSRAIATTWHVFFSRIFLDPSFMALRAFREFPDVSDFLHGSSIKLLGLVSGTEAVSYYPASFVGDLWRNFGFWGVVIGSMGFGFFFQYVQDAFFQRKSAFTLSVYVIFLVNAIWLIFGNALGTVSLMVFAFGLILLGLVRLLSWHTQPSVSAK